MIILPSQFYNETCKPQTKKELTKTRYVEMSVSFVSLDCDKGWMVSYFLRLISEIWNVYRFEYFFTTKKYSVFVRSEI